MTYISHLKQTTQSGQFLNRAVGDALLNAMRNTNRRKNILMLAN